MMGSVKARGARGSCWLALLALAGCGDTAADRPAGSAAVCRQYREAVEQLERQHPELPVDGLGPSVEEGCRQGPIPMTPTRRAAVSAPGCKSLTIGDERPTPIRRRAVAAPDRPVPYFSTRAGVLPENGPATIAGVELPSGSRCPHYWATDAPVRNGLSLASRLADAFPETGLWPILWDWAEDPDHYGRPTGRPAVADRLQARTVLRRTWDEYVAFPGGFPGLAPGSGGVGRAPADPFRMLAQSGTLQSTPEAGWVVVLVPVNRPADVIAMLGFVETEVMSDEALTAVVRSWEERFGAVVTSVGPGELGLAVGSPPRDAEQAVMLAAEHVTFAPEEGMVSGREDLPGLARMLRAGAPRGDGTRSPHFWLFGWPD
jgi:Domain of unknown function (DUF4253)